MRTLKTMGVILAVLMAMSASVVSADNSLAVTSDNPRSGTFSLEATYDGTATNAFLIDESPAAEGRHIIEVFMYLDTAGAFGPAFAMNPGDNHQFIRARNPPTTVFRVHLRRQSGGPQDFVATLWMNLDSGSIFVGEKRIVPDAWQCLRFDWQASSSLGAGDGRALIEKCSGGPKEKLNQDNFFTTELQQLGMFAGVDPATNGTVFYDNFESRRAPASP